MNKNIFREYDIRGVYPSDIDEKSAYIIGRSYGSYIQEFLGKKKCVVGHDNRLSSPALSEALIKGITESGCDVLFLGLCTTPMYYYACIKTNIIIGIMITASHNPKDDNGFKFSFDSLANARGRQVYDFRDYTFAGIFKSGDGIVETHDIEDDYLQILKNSTTLGARKLKIVVDPGNGVSSIIARKAHEMFDLDLVMINDVSDGTFPNHHPDPLVEENLEQLKAKVLEVGADIGLAYDGDGDRVGVVDEVGHMISIDTLMVLFIRNMIDNVSKKEFLYDVKCSKVLEDEIKRLGGTPLCYRTGASYTRAKTNEENLPFGGELSGHLYFKDKWDGFDSGIYCGLRLLEILSSSDKSLSEMISTIPTMYNTPEIKVKTCDDKKFDIVDKVKQYCIDKKYNINDIDGVRVTFSYGWALVRASNTGPNLTLRFEADTEEGLKTIQEEFSSLVDSLL